MPNKPGGVFLHSHAYTHKKAKRVSLVAHRTHLMNRCSSRISLSCARRAEAPSWLTRTVTQLVAEVKPLGGQIGPGGLTVPPRWLNRTRWLHSLVESSSSVLWLNRVTQWFSGEPLQFLRTRCSPRQSPLMTRLPCCPGSTLVLRFNQETVHDFVLLFLPPCGSHLTPLATGSLGQAYLCSPHLEALPTMIFRACSSPAPTPVKPQLYLQYLAKSLSTPRCQSLITPGSDHPLVLEPHRSSSCPGHHIFDCDRTEGLSKGCGPNALAGILGYWVLLTWGLFVVSAP
jgi:hypothetical protein